MSERQMSHVSYLPSKIALITAATSMRGRTGGSVGVFITVVTGGSIAGVMMPGPPSMAMGTVPVLTPLTTCCRREGAQSRPGSSGEQEQRETRDTATNTYQHINCVQLYFSL